MIEKFKKEPLVKFLIISIVIYMAYGFFGTKDSDAIAKENSVTITANEIAIMAFGWEQRYNKVPTETELNKLIETRIKETVLYKEAQKMGLDKDDVVIKRRVVLNYRNLIQGLLVAPIPSDEELNTYFQENIADYIPDEKLSITQLFFDPDKRDETTLADAEKALVKLKNLKTFPTDLSTYGDQFMLANVYIDISPMEIRKYFGTGFTESIMQLEPNSWVGPILSGYGTHLVYINEKKTAESPLLEEVKAVVLEDYIDAKNKELVQLYIGNIIDQYEIIIQDEIPSKK